MTIYAFLGPSLAAADARAILADVAILPPASQGDVLRLIPEKPDAIAIIDGLFELVPSVWHKEILAALAAGIPVYGASSMGALRAAEMDTFGMVGVGEVYRWYASGVIEDDDEVAVTHGSAEHGHLMTSEALVNVRDLVRAAVAREVISIEAHDRIIAAGKKLFYPERSWRRIMKEAGLDGRALDAFRMSYGPSLKSRDAIELLTLLRDQKPSLAARPHFVRTVFFAQLEASLTGRASSR